MNATPTVALADRTEVITGKAPTVNVTRVGVPVPLPFVALTVVFALPIVLPFIALGLVVAIVGGPPWLVWRLVTRGRRRRLALAEDEAAAGAAA